MKLIIKPKKILYKNFPEYKGKEITFLGLRVEINSDRGCMVNVKIGDNIGELSINYFELLIKN